MSLLSKFRAAQTTVNPRPLGGRDCSPGQPLHAPPVAPGAAQAFGPGRFSNGLKEFLWQLHDISRGKLLDMGAVSQTTLNFFIDRGFKVYTEDFLSTWSDFCRSELERERSLPESATKPDFSPAARAERFLQANLQHEAQTFDAVLLWDLLDYLDRDAAAQVAVRLATLLRDEGAILAIFHTRPPAEFHRYRVLDPHNLELVPAPSLGTLQHLHQNREIQGLFEGFRSSKTFVGRDQLREGVFIK
jgi:hypothetical protein